jgi:hypothetical protein
VTRRRMTAIAAAKITTRVASRTFPMTVRSHLGCPVPIRAVLRSS